MKIILTAFAIAAFTLPSSLWLFTLVMIGLTAMTARVQARIS